VDSLDPNGPVSTKPGQLQLFVVCLVLFVAAWWSIFVAAGASETVFANLRHRRLLYRVIVGTLLLVGLALCVAVVSRVIMVILNAAISLD